MATFDVTVRGAGVFGLACAWEMVQRGARVQVIDPHGPAAGASGGILGALAPHTPENWNAKKAFQFESLVMAEPFWRGVQAASGQPTGFARTGRLQAVADPGALTLARARAQGARQYWQDQFHWRVLETVPAWAPSAPMGCVIEDGLSALLFPRQATQALAAAVRARGGTVVPDGPAQGVTLWATGVAGLAALSEGRTRSVGNGVKGQAALLKCDRAGAPQLFAEGLHIIPHLDGTVAVGSTSERDYADGTATDEGLDALIERARALVPALAAAPVVERWAAVRPRARSRP